MVKVFLSCCLIFALSGCGSGVYSRDNTFLPPKNTVGSRCVQQCLLKKQKCLKDISCNNVEPLSYEIATMVNDLSSPEYNNKHAQVKRQDCRSYSRCESLHIKCFKSCKGEVLKHRNCVDNCDLPS